MSGVPRCVSRSLTFCAATGVNWIIPWMLLSDVSFGRPGRRRRRRSLDLFQFHQLRGSARPAVGTPLRDAGTQRRLRFHPVILGAAHTSARGFVSPAYLARLEIRQSFEELALDLPVPFHRFARLAQLGLEQAAQSAHRLGTQLGPPPRLEHLFHLLEGEAHAMEELDPPHAVHRARLVEPEPSTRSGGRLEESQLFVEMNRARGLARQTSKVTDANQTPVATRGWHVL